MYKLIRGIKIIIVIMMITVISFLVLSCNKTTSNYNKKMYLGIKNGNLEQINEALSDGANINKISGLAYLGNTNPFLLSFKETRYRICEYLVTKGADVNYSDIYGQTPLIHSSLIANMHLCKLLLEHGADLHHKDKQGFTALDYLLRSNRSEKIIDPIVTMFLNNGAEITPKTFEAVLMGSRNDGDGDCRYFIVNRILKGLIEGGYKSNLSPILEAVILGDSEKVNLLIKENKFVEKDKQQILFYTAAFGKLDTLMLLDKKKFNLSAVDWEENNILMIAAKYGQVEIVKYLLSKGMNIEAQNRYDDTALIISVDNNQYNVTEYLIKNHANMQPTYKQRDETYKKCILDYACENGNIEIMKLIISSGYPMNHEFISSAMTSSVDKGQREALKFLLKYMPDINDETMRPLSYAILNSDLEIFKILVDNGAKVNGKKDDGDPLHTAATYGETEIVKYLIEIGANVNAVPVTSGQKGDSALMSAVMDGYLDIVKLLVENGSNLEYKNERVENETVVIIAAGRGSSNVLKYLIKQGANINYQDSNGQTALMEAVRENQVDNVKVLLKNKADSKLKDKDGLTALDIARSRKNIDKEIIRILER